MDRIKHFLNLHQDQWYFVPALGLIFLPLILVPIIFISKTSASKPSSSPSPSPSIIPSPTPTPSPTSGFSTLPSPTPKPATPKPSAKPSPSPSPTPSPTPDVEPQVRINKPEHRQDYDDTKIDVDITILGGKKVEKVEVLVDGAVKKTWDKAPYTTTLELSKDSYELYAKAWLEGGQEIKSGTLKFGVDGASWDQPDPTPTPSPSPTPTPSS